MQNSMLDALTPEAIANECYMMDSNKEVRLWCFVEGPTDERVFTPFLNHTFASIKVAGNKPKALEALEVYSNLTKNKAICIVDADFDHILEKKTNKDNVFYTDYHDLLVMIFHTDALQKVLAEYLPLLKIDIKEVRTRLVETCFILGLVRLFNERNKLMLRLDTLCGALNENDLPIILDDIVMAINNLNYDKSFCINTLKNYVLSSQQALHYDDKQICQGHDLIWSLYKYLYSLNIKNYTKPEHLESFLRCAYEYRYFQQSKLYSDIYNWSKNNKIEIFEH